MLNIPGTILIHTSSALFLSVETNAPKQSFVVMDFLNFYLNGIFQCGFI